MEHKYAIKINNKYEIRKMHPPVNSNHIFFRNLLLVVEEQLRIIKNDILSYFPNHKNCLYGLKHDDWEIQAKINKLVLLRKINIITRNNLKSLLQEQEFIICKCGSNMYKTPINVKFQKVGSSYIILDSKYSNMYYAYMCESCFRSVSEIIYGQIMYNKELREKLLEKGDNFVPTDYGCWYYVDKTK